MLLEINGDPYRLAADETRPDAFSHHDGIYAFTLRPDYQRAASQSADASKGVHRSELVSLKTQPFDRAVTLSYDFMVADGARITSDFCNAGQWHGKADKGERSLSPAFAVRIEQDMLRILTRGPGSEAVRYSAPLKRDHWYSVSMRLVFSPTHGALVLSLDGKTVIDERDIPLGYDDLRGPYWQFGVYKRLSPEVVQVRYRNIKGPARDGGTDDASAPQG